MRQMPQKIKPETKVKFKIVYSCECGVYWTKFECISGKIRRILTNDTCASAALDKLARGKTQKFPSFQMFRFAAGGVGGAANKNDRKFLGLLPLIY